FSLITGFFIGTPVTYLEVFEGEKLIVSYKGVTAEYLIEDGIPKCSQEYLAQAEICEKQGNTPIIEINKDGCRELVRCEAACPDIREEINKCAEKGGNTKFGRDKNNCPFVLDCEMPPITEEPGEVRPIPPEIINLGLMPPSNIYCSFDRLEKENLNLIEISNVKLTEKMAQGSKIEYNLTNKGYFGEYVVSISSYDLNNEFLSAFNTFNKEPLNGETKRIGTQHFLKNNVKNQKLVFEMIGINGKLLGSYEFEVQVD
ncbi:hypothetical protein HY837_02990, partial [archaeon]|nr:hypothetical protein [archaeon]